MNPSCKDLTSLAQPSHLLSIHPRHVANILAGTKTVECRKSAIGLSPGTRLYLYATAPTKAILGEARVAELLVGPPAALWAAHHGKTGVTEAEYFAYCQDAEQAVLLSLTEVARCSRPASLALLRELQPGFSPPQTARRLGPAFSGISELLRDGS